MTDIAGNTSTAATIGIGESVSSTLEAAGDHDWFAITLNAGDKIVITLTGAGGVPLEDPYLYMRDSAGNLIAENDDGGPGRNSQLVFTATTSGTYYIDAAAWNDAYAGDYQLSVQPYTPPPVFDYDQIADQLVNGYWDGDWHHFDVSGGAITVNLTALASDGQALARNALALWSDVIGVTFTEVTTGGQITFDDVEDGAFTNATWTNHVTDSAQVNISTQWLLDYGTSLDGYAFQTYLHEIGHALGLGHAGNYNSTANYSDDALFANDAWPETVMSYFAPNENTYLSSRGFDDNFVMTPMNGDIVAMQALYGLSTTTRTGNTTYGFNSNADRSVFHADQYPDAAYAIFDSGGIDTLDFSGFATRSVIDLNAEHFSSVGGHTGNVAIGRGVVIENAIAGSGNDELIGNAAANLLAGGGGNDALSGGAGKDRLFGEAGNDTLDGGVAADIMNGGTGDDVYFVDNANDQVVEYASAGNDTVYGAISYALGSNVENLRMLGSGNLNATGNSLNNLLVGNSGANVLTGGGGSDTMWGGGGNDTYYVDSAGDRVAEYASQGNDSVYSAISYTLGDNLESLRLLGSGNIDGFGNGAANLVVGTSGANVLGGGAGNDTLWGSGGNDKLYGEDGNDTLDGGTGADIMNGGVGDDSYYVDSLGDSVIEYSSAGNDTVYSAISYTLGNTLENLRLTGSASINATGNAAGNLLVGNGGANVLTGGAGNDTLWSGSGNDRLDGGTGNDRMAGGAGADTFVFHGGDFGNSTAGASDAIQDFSHAQGDIIDLSAVDANSSIGGDQGFAFLGTGAFTGAAGQLRYQEVSGNTFVYGDTNGDGVADFMIQLDGSHPLTSGDFLL